MKAKEKGMTEEGMASCHGITDSMDMVLSKLWGMVKDKGGLACCSPWDCKELDTTE